MEHLVRILNDDDRQTIAWLCTHVGETRVADAAHWLIAQREQSAVGCAKPYLSAVCRHLGVWPPTPHCPIHADANHEVADRYLAQLRQLLSQHPAAIHRPARKSSAGDTDARNLGYLDGH